MTHKITSVYYDLKLYHYTCSCGEVIDTPSGHIALEVRV